MKKKVSQRRKTVAVGRRPKSKLDTPATASRRASSSSVRDSKQPRNAPSSKAEPENRHAPPPLTAGDVDRRPSEHKAFPVVGIGASAGGLEALEAFLRHVPDQSGMAFVIIQHLDPSHKGSLIELLQRATRMPVTQVKDHQKVEANSVYVIPPGKDMSIFHGELRLLEQASPRGLNLPIDFFFRSLAEDQQEKSIGVILSGMGSDGTLGLRALKEKAGASFVQSPSSAKFDGMPRSAIDASLADVVAPVEELPARIVAYREHTPYIAHNGQEQPEEKAKSSIDQVFALLRSQTGNDFSLYKTSTIQRRIERRMGLHQIHKIAAYVRFLRAHPREIELLFRELLIGVTNFFRDPPAWDFLRNELLPTLLSRRPNGSTLRAWVPGCSTGEEAYSLAIVFREVLEALKPPRHLTLQIFATDLDEEAIEKARLGAYPANIVQDVSADRLRRFFIQDERRYRVSKDIRDMVVFAPQNIIMDPPFTKLDILSCRNLLIYLAPELQKKLIPLFHYALNRDGILFLGSAETIGSYTGLFVSLEGKTRLYRRLEAGAGAIPVEFPVAFTAKFPGQHGGSAHEEVARHSPINVPTMISHLLVQHFTPSAVLTSDKGDVLYISGRTGKYLEPAAGKANMNLFAMARPGLRLDLTTAFANAQREERAVIVRGVTVGTNGGAQVVDLTVQKLVEPKELRGTMLVVFSDAGPSKPPPEVQRSSSRAASSRLNQLAKELQRAQDEIQTTREEMQTSQEELKSTNEELQSTNEELQSTNEELTTSKEEMQSMNEELQTVNQELHAKLDELSRSNNDMKNLLNSTDIATLFLDSDLMVRRFTTPIASIIKLIPSDIGRPITDITRDIDYPDLIADAREVLRTLVYKEKLVGATHDRWFTVRIIPYRTLENVIDGVVITFTDAALTRAMEASLRQQANELRQMAESLPNLVLGCRTDGTCDYVSPQWTEYTGVPAAELIGHGWLHTVAPQDHERVRGSWQAAINAETPLNAEFRIRAKDGALRWFKARTVPIRNAEGKVVKWYGTNSDIDDVKLTTERRGEADDGVRARSADQGDGHLRGRGPE